MLLTMPAKGGGQRGIGRVGIMRFARDVVSGECQRASRSEPAARATERDEGAAAGRQLNRKTLGLEPRSHLGDIAGTGAKLIGKLLRSQPFVKLAGCRVLLAGQKLVEALLLGSRWLEVKG